jgi:hypothetical protein
MTSVPTEAEPALVQHLRAGTLLNLTNRTDRAIRSEAIRSVLLGRHPGIESGREGESPAAIEADPRGLRIKGARIADRLDLDGVHTEISLSLEDCELPAGLTAEWAHLRGLSLIDCRLGSEIAAPPTALNGGGLQVDQDLVLEGVMATGTDEMGAVWLRGAHVGGILNLGGASLRNESGPALFGDGLRVGQALSLDGLEATGSGEWGAVRLVAVHVGSQLSAEGAKLRNSSGPALIGDDLQTVLDLYLNRLEATGAGESAGVRLNGARIGGQLQASDARLYNDSGPALNGDGLQVDEALILNRVEATGSGERGVVSLAGARVGGQFQARDARLHNESGPALNGDGLQVDEALILNGLDASGTGDRGVVRLNRARVGGALWLTSDSVTNTSRPSLRWQVDGLTYAGLPQAMQIADWLDVLKSGTPAYSGQPYRHLAAVARNAGLEADVRRILIAQRRDELRRATKSPFERAWGRFTGWTLGYGYQPWRALVWLLGTVLVAVVLVVAFGEQGLAQTIDAPSPGSPCTVAQRALIGVDLSLPVVKTSVIDTCVVTGDGTWLTAAGLGFQLLGWAFAILFVAGFTSAVRKT